MAEKDVTSLLEQDKPFEKEDPLRLYTYLLIFFALFPFAAIVFLIAFINALAAVPSTPPLPFLIPTLRLAEIVAIFLGSLFLVGAILLSLLYTRLRGGKAERIVNWTIILIWLVWAGFFALRIGWLALQAQNWGAALGVLLAVFLPITLNLFVKWIGHRLVAGYLLPLEPPSDQAAPKSLFQRWRDDWGNKERARAYYLLMDYQANNIFPCYVMTDEPREEDKLDRRIKGNAFAEAILGTEVPLTGVIITRADHAVAVSDGIKFKGIQGPGVIWTGFGDQPKHTLDLRPQLRTHTVHALTKDGIEVKVLFFAPFQIERSEQELRPGEAIPYRKNAAFRLVHSQTIEHPSSGQESTKQHAWDELPVIIGTPIMQDILSRYTFDDLYGPYNTIDGELPRMRIANEFQERFQEALRPLGLVLVGGGISNILPVKQEVLEQRIRSWQAEWTRQVLLRQASSHSEWLQRVSQARTEAQKELILALGNALAELNRSGAAIGPVDVMPHFLRVLEEIALRPTVKRYLPRDTVQDVRRIREDMEP